MGLLNFLPDDPNKKEAMRAGLLNLGAAMLSGRGNFGQMAGQGLGAGLQGYQGSLMAQQQAAQQAAQQAQAAQAAQIDAEQLKIAQSKNARSQQTQDLIFSSFGGSGAGQSGGSATSGQGQGGGIPSGGGIAPVAQPPRNGKFPLTLDQVALIKASGGPDLSGEYKIAHEGFERKQGSTYENPDGSTRSYARLGDGMVQAGDGSVSNARGYVGALAETEGAKAEATERAKAGYSLLPIGHVGEDGRPIGGTVGNYIAKVSDLPKVGGGAPPRPQMKPGAPVTPANFPRVTPQEQQARDGGRMDILKAELANERDPKMQAMIRQEMGGGRAPVLQSAAESKAQVGAVDVALNAGTKLNDNWITATLNPVQTEGKAAKSTLSQLQTIKHVNFQTGWGAPTMAKAAAILGSLGVKDAEKYASQAQSFQQVAKERLMTELQAQVGPQTEGDAQRAEATFMQLGNTTEANQLIADLAEARANKAIKKASYYNDALPFARKNGDLTEIDRRWTKVEPSLWADPVLAKYKRKK